MLCSFIEKSHVRDNFKLITSSCQAYQVQLCCAGAKVYMRSYWSILEQAEDTSCTCAQFATCLQARAFLLSFVTWETIAKILAYLYAVGSIHVRSSTRISNHSDHMFTGSTEKRYIRPTPPRHKAFGMVHYNRRRMR